MRKQASKNTERTANCGSGRSSTSLHLERAAVEDMLVKQLLPPHCHCSTCDLHISTLLVLLPCSRLHAQGQDIRDSLYSQQG